MVKAGKRLMILGAGPFLAPAIRKAAALGCHVITVDNLPDNIRQLVCNPGMVVQDGMRAMARTV